MTHRCAQSATTTNHRTLLAPCLPFPATLSSLTVYSLLQAVTVYTPHPITVTEHKHTHALQADLRAVSCPLYSFAYRARRASPLVFPRSNRGPYERC